MSETVARASILTGLQARERIQAAYANCETFPAACPRECMLAKSSSAATTQISMRTIKVLVNAWVRSSFQAVPYMIDGTATPRTWRVSAICMGALSQGQACHQGGTRIARDSWSEQGEGPAEMFSNMPVRSRHVSALSG